jgi:rRNA-processing protein FCF1
MKAYIDTSSVKVVLDTNALMVPEQFGVDIFSELLRGPIRERIRLPPAWH